MLLLLLLLIIKYFIARVEFENCAQELKLKALFILCSGEEMAGRRYL